MEGGGCQEDESGGDWEGGSRGGGEERRVRIKERKKGDRSAGRKECKQEEGRKGMEGKKR